MRLAIPKETHPGENRVPIIPDVAKKLVRLGAEVVIETGMGEVEHTHHGEDQGEAAAQHEQQQAGHQTVEQIDQDKRHRRPLLQPHKRRDERPYGRFILQVVSPSAAAIFTVDSTLRP